MFGSISAGQSLRNRWKGTQNLNSDVLVGGAREEYGNEGALGGGGGEHGGEEGEVFGGHRQLLLVSGWGNRPVSTEPVPQWFNTQMGALL